MAERNSDFTEAPDTCDETVEYDNRILDSLEIEPEEIEEEPDSRSKWEEIEQRFARYERNYRARRIREMTRAPLIQKRGRFRPRRIVA